MFQLQPIRRITFLVILLLVSGPLQSVTAGTGFPVKLKDQFHRLVEIKKEPRRIVSGSPGNTEILFALGLQSHIVGVTNWCNFPPPALRLPKIGDIAPLNVEKVLDLRPDLVVAHVLNGKEAVNRLSELEVCTLALNANSFYEILDSITLIGQATGRKQEASNLRQRLQKTLEKVRAAGSRIKQRNLKVYIVIGWEPNWTAGPGSFLDEAITLAGGQNIAGNLKSPWGQLSMEMVFRRNPDVIIADIDPGKIYSNPVWQSIAAVQKHQVYQIIGDEYYRPGPRLIESLEKLTSILATCR